MNSREFQLKFSDFIIAFECSFSACVRSKISLPDPDCLFTNTVSSGTRNWDEFTATLIQAHTDTSLQKSFSEAQVLKWEVLQLSGLGSLKEHGIASAGQFSALFYCDNCHKSCVIRPPFLAVSRSSAIALVCAHHMRINPMWCVLMTLVTFYTKTDMYCQPFGLMGFQLKWWLQIVLQCSNQLLWGLSGFVRYPLNNPANLVSTDFLFTSRCAHHQTSFL